MLIRTEEKVHAPEFPHGLVWLNSQPLSMAQLRGTAVLVNIWDYTCGNCIRTLPYIEEWYRRYASHGLSVIGVHAPEFDFAKNTISVERAISRLGITYPVVLDNECEIWTRYANQYWPHAYLVDESGYVAFDQAGAGNYEESELQVQTLLARLHPGEQFPAPYSMPGAQTAGTVCHRTTPELYAGYERGRIGNHEGYNPNFVVMYADPGDYRDGFLYLNGPWENKSQSLRLAHEDASLAGYAAVQYHALSVDAVLRPAHEAPYRVIVQQDGKAVPPEDRGEDLAVDAGGMTCIEVDEGRLYRIIRNRSFGEHALRLSSVSASFELYSITFGSCEIER